MVIMDGTQTKIGALLTAKPGVRIMKYGGCVTDEIIFAFEELNSSDFLTLFILKMNVTGISMKMYRSQLLYFV